YEENAILLEAKTSIAYWSSNYTQSAGAHNHGGATGFAGTHNHGGTTGSTGGNQPFENRPPYYALAFIMKL
ncbi:MAG: hypothetical protein ACK4JE_04265, partial [Endomicrobiia bacterium]